MIVKNIDQNDIEVPYEGTTYIFPKGKVVSVEDGIAEFVTEKYPLSFSHGANLQKKEADPVETYQTKKYIPENPLAQRQEKPREDLPNGIDKDGVSWYGDGIEEDSL